MIQLSRKTNSHLGFPLDHLHLHRVHVLHPPLLLRLLRQRVRPQSELVLLPPGDAKLAAVGLGDLPHGHPGGEVPPLLHLRGEVGGAEAGGEAAQFTVGGRVAAGGGGLEEEVADGAGKPGARRERGIVFPVASLHFH